MNTTDGKTAKRYSKALFDVLLSQVKESNNAEVFDKHLEALREISGVLSQSDDLKNALEDPSYKKSEQLGVLQDVAKKVCDTKEFVNFISLLFENKRISGTSLIAKSFDELVRGFKRSVALRIVSAAELPSEEKESIQTKVSEQFGSLTDIEWSIDASLIGGMIVKVGDKHLDGSVLGNLEKIKAELLN